MNKKILAIFSIGILILLGTVVNGGGGVQDKAMGFATSTFDGADSVNDHITQIWVNENPLINEEGIDHLRDGQCLPSPVLNKLDNIFGLPSQYDGRMMYWNHFGHGYPSYLKLDYGNLYSSQLYNREGLSTAYVVFVASCLSFGYRFYPTTHQTTAIKRAIISNNPDYYIGYYGSPPINKALDTSECFWEYYLEDGFSVYDAAIQAAEDNGMTSQYFGLGLWKSGSGDLIP